MSEEIVKQLKQTMSIIKCKKEGNADENDVQRELGILYYLYTKGA